MNGLIKHLFVLITITFNSFPQEISDSLNQMSKPIHVSKNFTAALDELDYFLELKSLDKTFLINIDTNTKWLWTSYAISNSGQTRFQSNENFVDMTRPLYQKYLKDSKFSPYRYALGMIQVGAVGYLAYKHIKKYGFLKK